MKFDLLPGGGRFYKANLHTHTTVSDGKLTPAEAKEWFKSHGYSVVAYTDHEVIVPHPELCDDEFVALTSYEIAINKSLWTPFTKTYHLNLYFRNPETTVSATFNKGSVWGNAKEHVTDEMIAASTEKREYTKEFVQWIVDTATKENALVSYNHPVWSLQSKDDYSGIKGFFGVEWSNTGCVLAGYPDDMQPIHDLLSEGETMCYPLAVDDCHSLCDYGGGWVQIKAPALTHEDIYDALKKGDFYSSTGPEIHELYVEGNEVVIKTSGASQISFVTEARHGQHVGIKHAPAVTEARFKLDKLLENHANAPEGHNCWFRIDVLDQNGKVARTRAYFASEIVAKMG